MSVKEKVKGYATKAITSNYAPLIVPIGFCLARIGTAAASGYLEGQDIFGVVSDHLNHSIYIHFPHDPAFADKNLIVQVYDNVNGTLQGSGFMIPPEEGGIKDVHSCYQGHSNWTIDPEFYKNENDFNWRDKLVEYITNIFRPGEKTIKVDLGDLSGDKVKIYNLPPTQEIFIERN